MITALTLFLMSKFLSETRKDNNKIGCIGSILLWLFMIFTIIASITEDVCLISVMAHFSQ